MFNVKYFIINTSNHRKKKFRNYLKPEPYRINRKITAPRVRLVGEGIEAGIYSMEEALSLAKEKGEDLVEISPKADPPVCKIINYSKFKYEKKKKDKLIKSKTQKVVIKELRFSPNTDEHDFDFKARHAIKFLQDGAKLKATLNFSGRELKFKERGEIMLLKFAQALEDYGKIEQMPQLQGRRMTLLVSPLKLKNK